MDKSRLRTEIRTRLQALSQPEQAARSRTLAARLLHEPYWSASTLVGLFAALPGEPDLSPLWAHRGPRTFAFPRITGEQLIFQRVADPATLQPSRWNLLEPPPCSADSTGSNAEAAADQLDLLLVPGLAFTADGHRMGRGRGYYDRFLASPGFRAVTVGICFREQLVETLPREAHDLPVDHLLIA